MAIVANSGTLIIAKTVVISSEGSPVSPFFILYISLELIFLYLF